MIIDSIQNGIVIDHITAGKSMELYQILGLDQIDCTVAILKNVTSGKLGCKDIIKIDREMDLDWDLIGYVGATGLATGPHLARSSCLSASVACSSAKTRAASPPLSRSCRRSLC